MTIEQHADELVKLSVTDLIELKKVLKDKYGLEINEALSVALKEEIEEVKEEKTSFKVSLTKVSEETSKKLNAVKEVNRILNVGLKQAMEMVKTSLPVVLNENASNIEAQEIKTTFAAFEAEVELS
jgi:ribosomal protein L7/L12